MECPDCGNEMVSGKLKAPGRSTTYVYFEPDDINSPHGTVQLTAHSCTVCDHIKIHAAHTSPDDLDQFR